MHRGSGCVETCCCGGGGGAATVRRALCTCGDALRACYMIVAPALTPQAGQMLFTVLYLSACCCYCEPEGTLQASEEGGGGAGQCRVRFKSNRHREGAGTLCGVWGAWLGVEPTARNGAPGSVQKTGPQTRHGTGPRRCSQQQQQQQQQQRAAAPRGSRAATPLIRAAP